MECDCGECEYSHIVEAIILGDLWDNVKSKNKELKFGLLCESCILKKIEYFK